MRMFPANQEQVTSLSELEFIKKVQAEQVKTAFLEVDDNVYNITGTFIDDTKFETTVSKESNIIALLLEKGVDYDTDRVKPAPWWMSLLTTLLPIILLI